MKNNEFWSDLPVGYLAVTIALTLGTGLLMGLLVAPGMNRAILSIGYCVLMTVAGTASGYWQYKDYFERRVMLIALLIIWGSLYATAAAIAPVLLSLW